MLVLSRKIGEPILMDGGISVMPTKIEGNRVTLGIEAPKNIRIVRGEVPIDVDKPLRVSPERLLLQDIFAELTAGDGNLLNAIDRPIGAPLFLRLKKLLAD